MTPLIPGLLPRFPSLRIFSVFSVTKLISGSRKYSEATQRPFSRPGVGEDKKKKKAGLEERLLSSSEVIMDWMDREDRRWRNRIFAQRLWCALLLREGRVEGKGGRFGSSGELPQIGI
jgi:hypothetical protein